MCRWSVRVVPAQGRRLILIYTPIDKTSLAIPVAVIVFSGLEKVWRLRVEEARARARAVEAAGSGDVEALRAELAELRQQLSDVQERLDFTERVLIQDRDRPRLPESREAR